MPVQRNGQVVRVTCGHVDDLAQRCATPATHVIVHTAQLATVADNSAGEDSIAMGAPAPDAVLLGVRQQPIAMEGACAVHVDEQLARYQRLGLVPLQAMTLAEAGAAGVRVADS